MELFKVVGLVLVVQAVHATYYCEDTWKANQNNGFCYKFFPEIQGWKQARQNCTDQNGFLISVTDENEQNFIVEDILENNLNGSVWIGGHSLYFDGWRWDNYWRNFNFSQWDFGSPVSASRCIAMVGMSWYNWSDAACEDLSAFICEKPAKLLNCDGEANIVQLEPNKLTRISFPPFYDPQQPFLFPPYERNLSCVWNVLPPTGYRIILDFDLLCDDDLRAFQGNTSLDNISCNDSFGNYELEDLVLQLSFTTNSITKLRSEQGFQFRFFATSLKGNGWIQYIWNVHR